MPKKPPPDDTVDVPDHVMTTEADAVGFLALCRECGAWFEGDPPSFSAAQHRRGCPQLIREKHRGKRDSD